MSWQMHAVAAYLRVLRKPRTYGSARAAATFLGRPKQSPQPPVTLADRKGDRLVGNDFGPFSCFTLLPRAPDYAHSREGSVVYIHGGGYVGEIRRQHWDLAAELADACCRPVHLPIYGLAPKHQAAEAVDFIDAVIRSAAQTGPVHLVGDSSGGGLAFAAAQRFSVSGSASATLCGLTLISPWLDIALRNPEVRVVARRDPWLSAEGLRYIGQRWLGDLDDDDPRVSPLFGDVTTLPPVHLYVGTRDLFMPDCRLLRDRLVGTVDYHEESGAVHIYPLLPVPEGRRARLSLMGDVAATFAQR